MFQFQQLLTFISSLVNMIAEGFLPCQNSNTTFLPSNLFLHKSLFYFKGMLSGYNLPKIITNSLPILTTDEYLCIALHLYQYCMGMQGEEDTVKTVDNKMPNHLAGLSVSSISITDFHRYLIKMGDWTRVLLM